MDKKEFLSFSLPYDLMIAEINDDGVIVRNSRLYPSRYNDFSTHDYYKPYLIPLSDLTKQIEHNGETLVPLRKLLENSGFDLSKMSENETLYYKDVFTNMDLVGFNDAMYLVSIHFDIFDLISKNEAIDVNTLEINPYK